MQLEYRIHKKLYKNFIYLYQQLTFGKFKSNSLRLQHNLKYSVINVMKNLQDLYTEDKTFPSEIKT